MEKHPSRHLYLLFTLCELSFLILTQGGILEHVHFGYYLDLNQNINLMSIGTVSGASLVTCLNSCKASNTCQYVNFGRHLNVCFQIGSKSALLPAIVLTRRKYGYVHGRKTDWNQIVDGTQASGCGSPPPVTLAESFGNMYALGGKVQYMCANNTSMTDQIICKITGFWSTTQLTCITECSPAPTLLNAHQTGSSLTVGSEILYTCNTADEMSDKITCGQDGSWSHTNLSCLPDECFKVNSIHVYGRSCYIYISTVYAWETAKSNCEDLGGYLAEISDAAEMENIRAYVQRLPGYDRTDDNHRVYIGLTDTAIEGNFTWLSGTVVTYSNFIVREPNGGLNENCVMFTTWNIKWYDMRCSRVLGSLCEFDLS